MSNDSRSTKIFLVSLLGFFGILLSLVSRSTRFNIMQEWEPFTTIILVLLLLYLFGPKLRIDRDNSANIDESRALFTADKKIGDMAKNEAARAIAFANSAFKINLDMTDESIKDVESILGHLHYQALEDKTASDEMILLAKAFGGYIGEVYRNNRGAEWGSLILAGESFPVLRCKDINRNLWPWSLAQNRILEGAEYNVWNYYQDLIGKPN